MSGMRVSCLCFLCACSTCQLQQWLLYRQAPISLSALHFYYIFPSYLSNTFDSITPLPAATGLTCHGNPSRAWLVGILISYGDATGPPPSFPSKFPGRWDVQCRVSCMSLIHTVLPARWLGKTFWPPFYCAFLSLTRSCRSLSFMNFS